MVEEALKAANNSNLDLLKKLTTVLEKPYQDQNNTSDYQSPSPQDGKKYQTFCGT